MKRLSFCFPKTAHLLSHADYQLVSKYGERRFGTFLTIEYRIGKQVQPRLGITASKKFGKAHDRNRFKRIVREVFRLLLPHLPNGLELVVKPRPAARPSPRAPIVHELNHLLDLLRTTTR